MKKFFIIIPLLFLFAGCDLFKSAQEKAEDLKGKASQAIEETTQKAEDKVKDAMKEKANETIDEMFESDKD